MYDTYSTVQYSTRSYMANTIWYNIIRYIHSTRTYMAHTDGTTSYTCTIHTVQYTIVHDTCDTAQDRIGYTVRSHPHNQG